MAQGRYQASEVPVDSLTPDQVREEAADLRHQINCVNADLASKKAWMEADGKMEDAEYRTWKAKARSFWCKLQKRYSLVRRRERKLNRAEFSSKRHVTRAEFEQLQKDLKK